MRQTKTVAFYLAIAFFLFACSGSGGVGQGGSAASGQGTMKALFALDTDTGVASIRLDVSQGTNIIATQTIHPTEITPPGSLHTQPGGDAFFVLDPGAYTITATPLDDAGNPTKACAVASASATGSAGKTTEITLALLCSAASGGLDVIVTTEQPPVITKLTFDPSKLIRTCEFLTVTVTAEDADGGPLTESWSVASSPAGADFTLTPHGVSADFSARTAGDYTLTVTVTDSDGNTASLTFPVHVSAGGPCNTQPGSAIVNTGLSLPKSIKGAPFPHFDILSDEGRNEQSVPRIPRGELRGTLSPSNNGISVNLLSTTPSPGVGKPLGKVTAQAVNDPVVFAVDTPFGNKVSFSGSPPDMSGASGRGNVVLATGNTFAALSTDGGATFKALDPTTIFPSGPTTDASGNRIDGGLCCDQVIQYAPQIDRFIWLMQFWGPVPGNLNGPNMLRIASASPQDIINSGGTAWTYWDLRSATFNMGNGFMDYPDMSVGANNLYLSVDQVGTGLLVVRIPLAELRDGVTIHFDYTNPANSGSAYGGHLSQNTGDEIFWAGHLNTSQMQIFNLHEGSNTYFWRTVNINSWPNSDYSSITPSGVNWLSFGFPGGAVIGAARRGTLALDRELWFAWMAGRGGGFPHPHIQIVKINGNNFSVIEQTQVWNPDHAFAYPSLATNLGAEVGIALAWGGGNKFEASSAVGILGDFVVWAPRISDASNNRWGDYLTVRQAGPNPNLFSALVYNIVNNTPPATGTRFDPRYILFGRQSVVFPPPPPG
ncbi:MAG: hypothetical protein HY282_15165 [Nitrospirae bacterium]|nr:hypothetical protein [Candidatus Manganitrophaceae bacterium]